MRERKEGKITVITADDGKVFRRISDKQIFGNELWLGMAYMLNNEILEEPLQELQEHYEEIDEPIEVDPAEEVVISEEQPLEGEYVEFEEIAENVAEEIAEKRTVTVQDYTDLEKKVKELEKLLNKE